MKSKRYSRRAYLGQVAAGGVGSVAAVASLDKSAVAANASEPQIKIAGYAYDRVRAIENGSLGVDGYDVRFHSEGIYSLNRQMFGSEQPWDVSETGLIPFVTRFANDGFRDYTLLPVFISRTFRHRNIFVRTDRGIDRPEDLRGRRVATPGYGMSSHTWIRGFLQDEHGVRPDQMHWIETTRSSDGGKLNTGFAKYFLPDGFPLERGPEGVDESDLIIEGKVDALVTAIEPRAYTEGHPKVRRLFSNVKAAEQDYFKRSGVFPIMHAVAIRREFAQDNPAVVKAIFEMYCEAKRVAYRDLESAEVLKLTLPWVNQEFETTQELMGNNYWPYGIEANRKELELVMRYTHEQGLSKRCVEIEEVFHPATLSLVDA